MLTSCPLGPDVAGRVQISGWRMESLKKKFNEIGMQASGSYQSSFCVICNGKYHLLMTLMEEKKPKPHTRTHNNPKNFQSPRGLKSPNFL